MNVVTILGTIAFFGVAHSLTAGPGFRRWAQRVLGERLYHGTYRLLYNLLSVLTLIPLGVAIAILPDQTLYGVSMPWAALLVALQALGAIGLAATIVHTGLFDFVGLRQLLAMLNGQALPLPTVPFQTGGAYALVRHPLYLFSLLFIWATPVMTLNVLLFNLGATAYFVAGSYPEERKLLRLYGEPYRAYQQSVPRLLPWPRPTQQGAPDQTLASD